MAIQLPAHTKSLSWTHNARNGRDVLRHFHDEVHGGGFDYCLEQPCHAIHMLVDDRTDVRL